MIMLTSDWLQEEAAGPEVSSRLPTINVIKPEPEDPGEAETFQRGRSPPPGKQALLLVSVFHYPPLIGQYLLQVLTPHSPS